MFLCYQNNYQTHHWVVQGCWVEQGPMPLPQHGRVYVEDRVRVSHEKVYGNLAFCFLKNMQKKKHQ